MNWLTSELSEVREIQRLEALLPAELMSSVTVRRSTHVDPVCIATEKVDQQRFAIQIDFIRWQQFSISQRDLLFWHEVARIQTKTIPYFAWEFAVMGTALFVSLIEVVSQNLLSFAIALVVTGLAGNQLYQRNRGERSLREATAADRQAIDLAVQAGYSSSDACRALQDALKVLSKQTPQKSRWKKYQVRLRVLEIFAAKQASFQASRLELSRPTHPSTHHSKGVNFAAQPLVTKTDDRLF